MSNANTVKKIRFSGSKSGAIMAFRWMGSDLVWPGMGRWVRMNIETARAEVATGEAQQYFVTGQFPEHPNY